MGEKKGTKRNIVAIAIGVIVIVIVAGVALYFIFNTVGIGKPKDVLVVGFVTTARSATTPETITFTSLRNGETYVASATGGTYAITLPNGDSYSVTITWESHGVTGGTANAGTLNLDTTQSSITENWVG